MTINDILAALASHNYLGLFLLLTLYARKLTSADSKFPLSISPTWRPIVSAFFGLTYGVLASVQAGMSVFNAVLGGVVAAGASGFLDGVLTAIFNHDNAPAWAKAIVFLFDDITGPGSGGSGSDPKKPIVKFGAKMPPVVARSEATTLPAPASEASMLKPLIPASPLPPPMPKVTKRIKFLNGMGFAFALAVLCGFALAILCGCASLKPLPSNIPGDVQAEVDCVVQKLFAGETALSSLATCVGGDEKIAADIVEWLSSQNSVIAKLPSTSPSLLHANVRAVRSNVSP